MVNVFFSTYKQHIKKGEHTAMARKFFTMSELQTMHLYEMPNMAYNRIINALTAHFGFLTDRLVAIFNSAIVAQLDQYIDLYSIIEVIA